MVYSSIKKLHRLSTAYKIYQFFSANSDYVETTFQLTFEPLGGSRKICRDVTIINDEIANEPDEQFAIHLTNANPVGEFGSDETCLTITDDDSELIST